MAATVLPAGVVCGAISFSASVLFDLLDGPLFARWVIEDNSGMNEAELNQLRALPQRRGEVWQGGLVRMPTWVTGEDAAPYRPYLPLWIAVRDDKVHAGELLRPHERNPAALVSALIEFALESEVGGYRPGRVEVADADLAEQLGFLVDMGIEVRVVETLEAINGAIEGLLEYSGEGHPPIPGPLEGEGVTVDQMKEFAEAAAAFYTAAPWQYLTDVDLLEIKKPKLPAEMRFATVLGAGRSAYGLGVYQSRKDYHAMRGGELPSGPDSPGIWHFTFDSMTNIPIPDADLWEDYRLPVASEEAYAAVVRINSRGEIRRPKAGELAFLEGLLRALTETTEAEIDSGRWQKNVRTHDGPTTVKLTIPDLLKPPTFQEWIKRGFEPDRRAHERMFADMGRYFHDHPPADMEDMNETAARLFSGKKFDDLVTQPETPLERAQEICYQAFDTHGRRRVQLAREAIEICPDCADAYVILAEQSGSLEAEHDYYAKGVAAGERALGEEAFEEHAGHFWGVTSTRPYMRAHLGLAQCLESLGRIDEAVDHYQEMLRLNPGDNQGVRYLLMPRLLQLGRDVEAARLLKESDEKSANWAYARALLAYRLSGRSAAARRELREAFRTNPHVPQMLVEDGPLPMPPHYSPGSPEEAIVCVHELAGAFVDTEGALDWLLAEHRQHEKELALRRKERRRKQRGQKRKKKGR